MLLDSPEVDAERVWREIENRRSNKEELPDLKELDAVSGGYVRDWTKEGCAATCEANSWCWSNDRCAAFEVMYTDFWATCPDGHKHVFNNSGVCTRCGYFDPDADYHPTQG